MGQESGRSNKLRYFSWNDEIGGAEINLHRIMNNILMTSKLVGKSRSRKYPRRFEFQKATHACAFCFCLGVSCSFASDTSPNWIDRERPGKRRTGTRQDDNDDNGDDDDDDDNADDDNDD